MTDYTHILVETRGPVTLVTLNRPEALNALSSAVLEDLIAVFAAFEADPAKHGGKTYEIAGPVVLTMRQLHERIAAAQGRKRAFFSVPDPLSALFAALPGTPMTSDQWTLLKRGNLPSGELPGLKALGVSPRPLGLFLDRWMTRYRNHGRFGDKHEAA